MNAKETAAFVEAVESLRLQVGSVEGASQGLGFRV